MLNFSTNIRASAGCLVVPGLNAFPDLPETREGLLEALGRVSQVLAGYDGLSGPYYHQPCLLALSCPRVRVGALRYVTFEGGFFLLGEHVYLPGAVVHFRRTAGGDIMVPETPDKIQLAALVPAETEELNYSSYNGDGEFHDLPNQVIEELDLDIDKMEEVDEDNIATVKYTSVYAPGLASAPDGRRLFAAPTVKDHYHGPRPLLQHLLGGVEYDEFKIEFLDRSQPYAYVAVELMNATGANEVTDKYAEIFEDADAKAVAAAGGAGVLPEMIQSAMAALR